MTDADPPLREVTLEEAMAIAILFQKHGQLADAEDVYRQIRERVPDHPDVLHFSGVLAHQQGRSDEAIALIEQSLALDPEQADCYSNLGIIFKAKGRRTDAIAAYQEAIRLNPEHANAHSNLGVLFRAEGKLADAEAMYRRAIELNPSHIDAYHNLGVLLAAAGRTKEAVACYCRVTTLCPQHPEARRLLAMAHCTLGEMDKAADIFRGWLAEDPSNAIAQHMLSAVTGQAVPARASDAYVERVFDDFSGSFDEKLASLSYRAPAIVGALVANAGFDANKALDVLDAGCGTGLCGPFLSGYARTLTGVDLSAGMLAQAEKKSVYDALVKDELTAFLHAHPSAYDVIVSADTLVYFGGLEDLSAAAWSALRPGGILVFTLEAWAEADGDATYEIGTHGRYRHARGYVERAIGAAGFVCEIVPAELRMEAGSPVDGLAVRARKVTGDQHA